MSRLAAFCNIVLIGVSMGCPRQACSQNDTPTSTNVSVFEPYGGLFDIGSSMGLSSPPGYDVYLHRQGLLSADDPDVDFYLFDAALGSGHGIFGLSTHGGAAGYAVMAWVYSQAGKDARDAYAIQLIEEDFLELGTDFNVGETSARDCAENCVTGPRS